VGADGALWFTESSGNKIGRITVAGAITEYPTLTANSLPNGITAGPDHALWFTETAANKIGKITLAGVMREYLVPTPNSSPVGIAMGPDGALWFAESTGHQIGRMTTKGEFTEYYVPGGFYNTPYEITAGPDGALWFTENQTDGNEIVRITTTGEMTQYFIPTANTRATGITTGPDGAIWFTEYANASIGRLTTAGVFSEYSVGACCVLAPIGITAGADGALWFTAQICCAATLIGRITTAGVVTKYYAPTETSSANGITAGPDGALWFAEGTANEIARAPACGLGFNASFAHNTVTLNFNLGIDTPATFNVLLRDASGAIGQPFSEAIEAVVPPRAFTQRWHNVPNLGSVTIQSTLTAGPAQAICSEWTTVDTQ